MMKTEIQIIAYDRDGKSAVLSVKTDVDWLWMEPPTADAAAFRPAGLVEIRLTGENGGFAVWPDRTKEEAV